MLEIASTYDQLITKQITFNLAKTFEDGNGFPAFVKVTNQTATTQNSITPTLSFPLAPQITNTGTSTIMAAGTSSQVASASQRAGTGMSLAASDQWNQTYTPSPVTDTEELRRLLLLFQYVTRRMPGRYVYPFVPDYGIGELPMVGVAAAIANAVYHATGVRVRKVPIRIEDILT